MSKSTATWRLIVTHFPCGHEQAWYNKLYKQFGFDLLVTGHRHGQELWTEKDGRNLMGAACIVTGGGGGITSEASPDVGRRADWYGEAEYGFYDLTISATELRIESINWDTNVAKTHTVLAKTKEEFQEKQEKEQQTWEIEGDRSEQQDPSEPSDYNVTDTFRSRQAPREQHTWEIQGDRAEQQDPGEIEGDRPEQQDPWETGRDHSEQQDRFEPSDFNVTDTFRSRQAPRELAYYEPDLLMR
jgi:hypothetical protein